jgi:hypothetical protein
VTYRSTALLLLPPLTRTIIQSTLAPTPHHSIYNQNKSLPHHSSLRLHSSSVQKLISLSRHPTTLRYRYLHSCSPTTAPHLFPSTTHLASNRPFLSSNTSNTLPSSSLGITGGRFDCLPGYIATSTFYSYFPDLPLSFLPSLLHYHTFHHCSCRTNRWNSSILQRNPRKEFHSQTALFRLFYIHFPRKSPSPLPLTLVPSTTPKPELGGIRSLQE